MSNFAVEVENLSKRYRIGIKEQMHDTFMGTITSWLKTPLANFRQLRKLSNFSDDDSDSQDVIWALKDVSFDVKQGDVVGLIGRNGAGKSTLLKIISRITEPTSGRAVINGRVSSLLEVGTGFHPELTGRENIYLNGIILGMSKLEMDRKFDEIVDFSGMEKFLDTPVKRYSSGMHVRLAFSVAAHLEPEILLVDEVLAVGDAAFQKKCLGKMGEVAKGGRTILFVSHNLEAIGRLCQRAILLDNGKIQADGDAGEVVQAYLDNVMEKGFSYENREYGLIIQKVVLKNAGGEETFQFSPGDDLTVTVRFNARQTIARPYFLIIVKGAHGKCFTASMLLDGQCPEALEGQGEIKCTFKSIPLLPQRYHVSLSIRNMRQEPILNCDDIQVFNVVGDLGAYGYKGDFETHSPRSTSVVVPYEWSLPDGSIVAVSLARHRKDYQIV